MPCDDRQLTDAQRAAAFDQQRTGVQRAIRPFSGEATVENLVDYLNRELLPTVKQSRDKLNEVFLQVKDNAPSGNPLGYYFSTETANADPTAGRVRLDNATQDTATTIRVSQSNGRLVDTAPWLEVMAGSATSPLGVVTLTDAINPGRFIRFDLDSMTDQGAYWDLAVTPVESSHDNPFVNDGAVVISFIPGVSSAGSSVPVSSLGDLAGLSVLGRSTVTTGPMAAIAASTARTVLRVIDAGTALNWGFPVEARDSGVDQGDVYALDFVAGTNANLAVSAASGVATITPSVDDFPLSGLADVTGPTLLGLETGTGAPEALTGAEAGHLIKKGGFATATVSADTNDWSPTGLANVDLLSVTVSGANRTVTGLDSTVFEELSGSHLIIRVLRATVFALTLTHNSGSSIAANRFICPNGASYVLQPGESALLLYGATGAGTGWQVLPLGSRLTGPEIADVIRGSGANVTVTGTINNWAPAGASTANWYRMTLTGDTTITGLDVTVFNTLGELANGRELLLFNTDTVDTLTLAHANIGSTSTNRFSCPGGGNLLVPPGGIVKLIVDTNVNHVKVVPICTPGADNTMLVNISGGTTVHQPRALSAMVSGGLLYDATSHTWQRSAIGGAVSMGDGDTTSVFNGIRINDALATARTFINFTNTSHVTFAIADDAGDDEMELRGTIANNAVANAQLANMPANTFKANPTGSSADPQDYQFSSLFGDGFHYASGEVDVAVENSRHIWIRLSSEGLSFIKNIRRLMWWDDFCNVLSTSVTTATTLLASDTSWVVFTSTGTGVAQQFDGGVSGTSDAIGELYLSTSSTDNSRITICKGGLGTNRILRATDVQSVKWRVRLGATTNIGLFAGLSSDPGNTVLDSAVIYFDTNADTTWHARSASSNGFTLNDTDLNIAADTSYHTLEIRRASSILEWDFYFDGALVANHATSAKTRGLNIFLSLFTRQAGAAEAYVDCCEFESIEMPGRVF